MEYKGKIYGKVSGKYIRLKNTTEDFEQLKADNEELRNKIKELIYNDDIEFFKIYIGLNGFNFDFEEWRDDIKKLLTKNK